ncbi:MAG: HAD family phosphatase [Rikenellaceae bacterium]|nr:HAD family phosphatase [Rikenellaceae bacterium]
MGGVVVARDRHKVSREFADFFAFVCCTPMPEFWVEYDRGTKTRAEVEQIMADIKGCPVARCHEAMATAIDIQAPIACTEQLIHELKERGYRLLVLSNMSSDFIEHIRRFDVYREFEGDVVSCEVKTVKPELAIYRCLLDRFELDPAETLFIDDREANLRAAEQFGITTFHFTEPREESCERLRELLLQ